MPGRLFHVSISDRFSGLSSGKLPRIAKRFGYLAAASSETLPEFGSQPGGCSRQALTPAASMSRMHSSAVYEVTWRCDGLVGGPADQMWTCAATISMAFLLLVPKASGCSILTPFASLRTLSRTTGEGGPGPQGWVGEGYFGGAPVPVPMCPD